MCRLVLFFALYFHTLMIYSLCFGIVKEHRECQVERWNEWKVRGEHRPLTQNKKINRKPTAFNLCVFFIVHRAMILNESRAERRVNGKGKARHGNKKEKAKQNKKQYTQSVMLLNSICNTLSKSYRRFVSCVEILSEYECSWAKKTREPRKLVEEMWKGS